MDRLRRQPVRAARLVSLHDGQAHLIGRQPLTIGREPGSDIPIDCDDVSRQHAYVLRTPQGFLLVDSSLHGTYINGERVQAQRLLTNGDVVEIGDKRFRCDLLDLAPELSDALQPVSTAAETTEHHRPFPLTSKVVLAKSLPLKLSWRDRTRIWIRRYGVSELAGIGMAFAGSWFLDTATGSTVAAAYGAAFGEGIGFYGSLIIREMIQQAYIAGSRRDSFGAREMVRSWRALFLEFGPAELLDAGLIRPLAMGVGIRLLGTGFGIVAGKLVADVIFYVPVIWTYERMKR